MFLTRWLRGTTRTPKLQRTTTRPRFRPAVQRLEGRDVPSTLTVTTALDVVDSNDGLLSLRAPIHVASVLIRRSGWRPGYRLPGQPHAA
jgi:hypothetical protein